MTTEVSASSVPVSHEHCLLCGHGNPLSMGLCFECIGEEVRAFFRGNACLQGYEGILHGGVVASLLDAAMTHRLFREGVEAVTAELAVRYLHPVPWQQALELRGRIVRSIGPLYDMEAELRDGTRLYARGTGRFMRKDYMGERGRSEG